MSDPIVLGERIKQLREQKGLTQRELENMTNGRVTFATISRWEREQTPTFLLESIMAIADALEVPWPSLVDGQNWTIEHNCCVMKKG